jgi:hypothetical protein
MKSPQLGVTPDTHPDKKIWTLRDEKDGCGEGTAPTLAVPWFLPHRPILPARHAPPVGEEIPNPSESRSLRCSVVGKSEIRGRRPSPRCPPPGGVPCPGGGVRGGTFGTARVRDGSAPISHRMRSIPSNSERGCRGQQPLASSISPLHSSAPTTTARELIYSCHIGNRPKRHCPAAASLTANAPPATFRLCL